MAYLRWPKKGARRCIRCRQRLTLYPLPKRVVHPHAICGECKVICYWNGHAIEVCMEPDLHGPVKKQAKRKKPHPRAVELEKSKWVMTK
jgi:hypothetical protein